MRIYNFRGSAPAAGAKSQYTGSFSISLSFRGQNGNLSQTTKPIDIPLPLMIENTGSSNYKISSCKFEAQPSPSPSTPATTAAPAAPFIPTFFVAIGDYNSCSGGRMATISDVSTYQAQACTVLGYWDIARINSGSMDGAGYNCQFRGYESRGLGHTLCVR